VSGACLVTVDASDDATVSNHILATGSVAATIPANATTKVEVILTAVPPSSGGAGGAGGAGGSPAAGGAGGTAGTSGAGGTAGTTGAGGSAAAGGAGGA
jgi:hypothetical protein